MGNNKAGKHEKEIEGGGSRKGHPRRYYVVCFLTFLLITELGLAAAFARQIKSLGYYQDTPIVQKTSIPQAVITPPPNLQPADNNTDTNANQDSTADVNLAVGTTPIDAQTPIDPNVINILVLGLDTRKPGGNGRSDLNMVVSIDRKNKTIKLASILRDTLVPIEGHDWNRLNSAYAFGGPGLTINTVNSVYKLDIQRYIKIDFFGIQDIIDAVGGVDVNLTSAEVTYLRSYGHMVSKGAGVKHLDGVTALAYARIREIDTDFQRTQRQRNVITAALGKARNMGVVQAINMMTTLLPQVKTNINTNEAIQLATAVLGMGGKPMKQLSIPVAGSFSFKKYNGMAIISVDFDKNVSALKDFLYTNK